MKDYFDTFLIDSIFEEKQEVDIGFRMDRCATVAADSKKCKTLWDAPIAPHFCDDLVNLGAYRLLDESCLGRFEKLILQVVNVTFELGTADHHHTPPLW